jgi:ornithine cyclodeaminase/alanine dehydrogenase-like protein (mu-crystallin family)
MRGRIDEDEGGRPMKALIADQKLVTELLPMDEAIEVMRRALTLLAEGDVVMPLRTMLGLPRGDAVMGLMPSYLGGLDAVGVKVVAAFPSNFGTEYDTHQGVVLFFDTERGLLRAIVDATSITAIRTAAVSGLVTDLLAKPDAGDLAIIGAGTQAHTHLQAMLAVRPVRRVRVHSVPAESAAAFAERETRLTGHIVEVAATAEEAVVGADLICTTTTATEPVVRGEWVSPGAHVNAVGAYTPTTRELDSALVASARLYADRRESLLNEAGEFLIPKGEGLIGDDHVVGEIGEVLTGKAPARTSPEEITLFKSLGIAIEDLAAAHHVHKAAEERGVGVWVEIGGLHFGSSVEA